jgi:hypothetical protein
MANQYSDLQIIECNRLHSEEAKSGNNENFAMWQTNLQDIVHLDAGDKVSVHGAMVSERGAGQPSSLEIKGVNLGFTKDFEFTTYEEKNASDFLASKYEIIECNASSQTISIRDDTLNFTTSYYINANGHNYMHLPRRWWYKEESTFLPDVQWTDADDLDAGLTYFNPFKDNFGFIDDYYQIIPTTTDFNASVKNFKPKNNNERYTILMRDTTYFSESSASGNLNASNVRDPENHIYRTFKQLKSINVPAGFNSPEYVAQEITRQLQNIKEVKRYEFRDPIRDAVRNASVPGFPIRMYDTIETETYKPFNVAYAYHGDLNADGTSADFAGVKEDFNFYIDGGNNASDNASGYEYLSQYHIVATKRPELYETGRLVNFHEVTSGTRVYRGIHGVNQMNTWRRTDNEIELLQQYNRETCEFWRDFFIAQELYPEIWNTFNDPRTDYTAGDTIDNSRWVHINRFKNASQSYTGDTGTDGNSMLGDSGYKLHSWNSSNELQPASALLPIFYKAEDRDIFYDDPAPNQYSFGCLRRDKSNNRIILTCTPNNGGDTNLFNMLAESGGGLVSSRRVGFDMHFSAPGMCYLLPYAGWSNAANSYSSATRTTNYGDYQLYSGYHDSTDYGENLVNSVFYRNKLYIGADLPSVDYDGTNFTISGLHTPMNKGNDNIADNDYNASLAGFGATGADPDAKDQVYVINPKEQWNDWTPARKPYRSSVITTKSGGQPGVTVSRFNDNLEAWTIYDALCGIFISDINLTENEWKGSLWDILGFSYNQFNSNTNTRLSRINNTNINDLSIITTNAEVNQGDSKIYIQNLWGAPLYNNMIGGGGGIYHDDVLVANYYPEIKQKTESVKIIADNLPIRMIRGYYTIRSNILQDTPFIGGKVNNTTMPIIGIVDKINGDGDFYFSQESSLQFTVTRPLRLASITCSLHDPDGSYARCTDQSAVLFKIEKTKNVTFNVAEELLEEQQQKK